MIVYKTWKTYDKNYRIKYVWHGWFPFGIIPLYVARVA